MTYFQNSFNITSTIIPSGGRIVCCEGLISARELIHTALLACYDISNKDI